jgi:uncharacterized protein
MSAGDWKDLYQAAVVGDLALVKHHISEGVNPDYQHPEVLCTPLVASLIHGHAGITRYLLAHGADPGLRSEFDGLTPRQAAVKYGRTEFLGLPDSRGDDRPRRPFWWRWLPI